MKALTLLLCLLFSIAAHAEQAAQETAPLGVALWAFNRSTFTDAVEKAHRMGFIYLQAYPRQKLGGDLVGAFDVTMDANTRKQVLELLKKNKVELVSISMNAKDDAGWREIFELGRDLGVKDITCEPKAADLPLLDQLSKEFGVTVSIYNHFANLDERLGQLEPYGKNMGLCADTGRWIRNGVDPVEYLKKAEPRLISLNLRDMDSSEKEAHSVIWGTGVGNMAGQIDEIKRQKFQGIVYLQYDNKTPHLDEDVEKCRDFYRQQMAK